MSLTYSLSSTERDRMAEFSTSKSGVYREGGGVVPQRGVSDTPPTSGELLSSLLQFTAVDYSSRSGKR